MKPKGRWFIHEGIYIEAIDGDILSLQDETMGDACTIPFTVDMIDDLIDGLKRAKSHFAAQELAAQEKEKLVIWGKAKTPTDL